MALIDDTQFGDHFLEGRRVFRLCERESQYQGPPQDGSAAIAELQRLAQRGVEFLVVGWPSMWWLQHYEEFAEYLRGKCQCICADDNVIIFDLRTCAISSGRGMLQ